LVGNCGEAYNEAVEKENATQFIGAKDKKMWNEVNEE